MGRTGRRRSTRPSDFPMFGKPRVRRCACQRGSAPSPYLSRTRLDVAVAGLRSRERDAPHLLRLASRYCDARHAAWAFMTVARTRGLAALLLCGAVIGCAREDPFARAD